MTENGPPTFGVPSGAAVKPIPTATATPPHGHLGLAGGTALYVAAVLGTGILVLPALAAAAAGPGAILAVAALAIISIPLAATFAALSRRYPDAGGVATFARRAFGPTAARVIGYWFFFGTPIGAPIAALMTARVRRGRHRRRRRTTTVVIAIALIAIPVVVTAFGVRFAGWLQLVLSAALVAVLVFVLASALPHSGSRRTSQPFLPHGWAGVGARDEPLHLGVRGLGGRRGHRRRVPQSASRHPAGDSARARDRLGRLPRHPDRRPSPCSAAAPPRAPVPLLDLVLVSSGTGGGVVVAVIAAIVVTGVFNAYLAAFSKLGAAMGRDGDLPRWFGRGVGERRESPGAGCCCRPSIMAVYSVFVLSSGELQPFILDPHEHRRRGLRGRRRVGARAAAAVVDGLVDGRCSRACSRPASSCWPVRHLICADRLALVAVLVGVILADTPGPRARGRAGSEPRARVAGTPASIREAADRAAGSCVGRP